MVSTKQLNPTDLMFVAGENERVYQHTGGLVILDTSNTNRFDFKYLKDRVIQRLERVPHFRWKLHEVPDLQQMGIKAAGILQRQNQCRPGRGVQHSLPGQNKKGRGGLRCHREPRVPGADSSKARHR